MQLERSRLAFRVSWEGRQLLAVVSLWLVLGGCGVGYRHTSDEELEKTFLQRETKFQALLNEVMADSKLTALQPHLLIYDNHRVDVLTSDLSVIDGTGLSRSRWSQYSETLRGLGLAGGVLKGHDHVEFRVDNGSVSNGDSYKGYEFDERLPAHVKASLNMYRVADEDRDEFGNWIVRKHIKGKWYIYLFVNR